MASWTPQDGTHGGLAGAPDLYCFKCHQFCGGTDANGNPLVCAHCSAMGLPPPASAPEGETPQQEMNERSGEFGNPYATTTDPTGLALNPNPEQPI